MSHRSEAELVRLRKAADLLARERRERVNTVHLLAVLCAQGGPAAQLLASRRLEAGTLLKAARAFDETVAEAIAESLVEARELARRAAIPSSGSMRSTANGTRATAAPEANGLHLLVSLLSNRRLAACRALDHLGIDVGRLRMAALQVAFGVVSPRRPLRSSATSSHAHPAEGARPGSESSEGRTRSRLTTNRSPGRPRDERSHCTEPRARAAAPAHERAQTSPTAPPQLRRTASPASRRSHSRRGNAVQVPLFPAEPTDRSDGAKPASAPRPTAARAAAVPRAKPTRGSIAAERSAERTAEPERDDLALDPAEFPTLRALGRNLSLAAAQGELEPVVAREPEVDQILDVLAKRHANSALLVGPPGVGKTSVARGIAHHFVTRADEGPPRLLIELSPTELLAGTGSRGTLAERAAALRSEVRKAEGRIVLFIDEIQDLVGSSSADELVTELKAALDRGEMPLVAATSTAGLRRTIEADAVLARRFTLVEVEEPDVEQAFVLLRSVADGLERHHRIRYSDEAIASAVSWSSRYLQGRALPDKAVSVLDLAGARVRRRGQDPHADATGRARGAVPRQDGTVAPEGPLGVVTPEAVADVVAEQASVPVERLLQSDRDRMLELESFLSDRVVGHEDALRRIATALRRNAAGLRSRRPIGSFLLLGPTGVGKTETAKAVAEALFNSPDAMTRLDMSEYSEAHSVARLIGAPPGYVGHESGGELTEAVRRRSYQVVLLDEIEKAHRDVLQAFLQVFDEGRLTDGRGRCTDFTNTVIVLTSNLGSAELRDLHTERRVGFGVRARPEVDRARHDDLAISAAKRALPPELYNRLDEVIVYGALEREDVREIAERQLQALAANLIDRDVDLIVDPDVLDALMASGGYEPEYGARPMRRAIARFVEGPLAELLLDGRLDRCGAAHVHVGADGRIVVEPATARTKSRAVVAASA